MRNPNPAVLEFLLTRRSRPAKTFTTPVPTRAELLPILTAGLRTPDHGKLEPWRLIVLERPALQRLAALVPACGAALGIDPDKIAKGVAQFADADLVVAVIHAPRSTEKIPAIEQILSTGAVCMSLLNAAHAAGWGANWLTGWAAHDGDFRRTAVGLGPEEWVAGLIHIGTETVDLPERPRPDLARVVTWMAE